MSRTTLLATLKYVIPVSSVGMLKFGGGIGYYVPGDLDLDFSTVSGGGHNVYSFDSNIGFHLAGDYEMVISPRFSWGFGMTYTNISYDLTSLKSNGTNIPLTFLSTQVKNDLTHLDGSSVDFSIFIAVWL